MLAMLELTNNLKLLMALYYSLMLNLKFLQFD